MIGNWGRQVLRWLWDHTKALTPVRTRTLAFAGIGLGAISVLAVLGLKATPPAGSVTRAVWVWQLLLGPQSGGAPFGIPKYALTYRYPESVYVDEDATVTVDVAEILKGPFPINPSMYLHISISSLAFRVDPQKPVRLKPEPKNKAVFIVSSSSPGRRSMRVVDGVEFDIFPDKEPPLVDEWPSSLPQEMFPRTKRENDVRVLEIEVKERPVFYFVDRSLMRDIAWIAGIIGLPALLLALLKWALRKRFGEEA
jgi:hypothetical protein